MSRRLLSAAGASILLATTLSLPALSASASVPAAEDTSAAADSTTPSPRATTAYGWGQLVNYVTPDGSLAYCIDVQADWPSGATGGGTLVGGIGATAGTRDVGGTELAMLNAGLSQFGQTTDNDTAAAVAAFVYAFTSQNHPGYDGAIHYISQKADGHDATVTAAFNSIWAWVGKNWAAAAGSNTATTAITMTDSTTGYIDVTVDPTAATGTLALTGAHETSTGATSVAVGNGSRIDITGDPADGTADYDIRADGSWSTPGGYASEAWMYETPGQQRLARGSENRSPIPFTSEASITASTIFQPIVTSEMQQTLVPIGGTIIDHATCDLSPDSTSTTWRRNRDDEGVEVTWDVAIYAKRPGEDSLPEVPEGRPALGTATATCDEVGDIMEASFPRPDEADGPITAVWSLDLDKQSDTTKSVLQGPWHDAFGLPDETTVIPRVTTKAVPSVMEGEQYGDTAHHEDVGLYPDTAVQTFTAYRITDGQPVCDATTEYLPESAPILVNGRKDVPGPTFTATRDMGTGVNWIERTYADDSKQVLLSEGVCGQEGEQTLFLDRPGQKLASTGFDGATLAAGAAATMLLGASPFVVRGVVRRRASLIDLSEGLAG
ncbi:hypothetical protein SAMN06295909_1423 [Plantibacter sp. VKM Ac-1784]|uniref:Uncharacterized protein n=1 Tax=Plantibacter elymi (nom. nud.) TaxID=199708 RepID=A0ABY1RBR9_9MICO|nr:hypothetical protein [Plantibacter sp. VKM Ac-1784]SMQ67018.1 hypothetical protein SAMN06295909_1423 [Plantibacter sp. VKM Ac-1784]